MDTVAVVPGVDGRKMSKSYGNTIPLFAEYEEIKKCVMGIVTDSSEGIPKNVYAIHNLLRPASELLPLYEELPEALEILKSGGEKAKAIASKKMNEVKEKIGVNVYE